jgi:hypothetical protein
MQRKNSLAVTDYGVGVSSSDHFGLRRLDVAFFLSPWLLQAQEKQRERNSAAVERKKAASSRRSPKFVPHLSPNSVTVSKKWERLRGFTANSRMEV